MDYVVNGRMIGGFAVIAYPAKYRISGITTFMVSFHGVVFEKDLGPETKKLVTQISQFNPDRSWARFVGQ